jgi:hypothetical protein
VTGAAARSSDGGCQVDRFDHAATSPDGRTVKRESLTRFALDRNVAAHHARELAGDGKPQAGAAEARRCGGVGLGKRDVLPTIR